MNNAITPLIGRKDKTIYRITTGIIVALMLISAVNFAFAAAAKEAFHHLGLPGWFKTELTIAKFLGSLVLLLPGMPALLKEFAYFGFGLTIVSADIAHLSSGDPLWYLIPHITFLGILVTSYIYYHKIKNFNSDK